MDFTNVTNEQLEARSAEIMRELELTTLSTERLTELRDEANAIATERAARSAENIRREARAAVAGGAGVVINAAPRAREERRYDATSPEYRDAWLRNIAVTNGVHILGDMTAEERDAFTFTTQNSKAVVPTEILDEIVELVDSMAPMYDDAFKTDFVRGFGVPRHIGIKAGDAKGVAEGTANVDEEDDFDLVSLAGVEIKKHVVLSRKLKFQSLNAFRVWLTQHLAERIAVARERLILARLDGQAPEGDEAVPKAAIDSKNILTAQDFTDKSIRHLMSLLRGKGARTIYANNSMIWDRIADLEDKSGKKLFVPNAQEDPVTQGRIYGATVKMDENIPDNTMYVIMRNELLANDFDDLEIIHSIDPKTAADIILGYTIFDAGMRNPKGAVKATFKAASASA